MTFVLRTANAPLALLPEVRDVVRSLDATLPISDVQTLDQVTDGALAEPRFATMLLGAFAMLALALATIGIYGVVSLLVTRRRKEIGIRMALGARPARILRGVIGRGLTLAGIGLVIGLAATTLLSGLVSSMLYGVTRWDPTTFATVPAVLMTIAALACLVPAARAASVDPARAMHDE